MKAYSERKKIQQQKSLAKNNKKKAKQRAREKLEAKEKRSASQFFSSCCRAGTTDAEQAYNYNNGTEGVPNPADGDKVLLEQINNHNDIKVRSA